MSAGPNDRPTVARPRVGGADDDLPTFRLDVVEGPDRGQSLVLQSGAAAARMFVGTSPTCQLVLHDPLVSRRHIGLALEPGGVRISDLESTNGTRVGGVEIVEGRLRGGETIEVGDTKLAVRRLDAPSIGRLPVAKGFGRLVGESPEMRRLYPFIAKLAASEVPVILEGETGTGKELLAEAIHEGGPRAAGPYVVFDCTTGPSTLLESQLFGHERGAFTGAVTAKAGVFEQANGGTLLIDEIGDLDLALQAKLLRAIERREVQRVGGTKWTKVDVRILAATRRDLEREIQAERFRDDLYYRLAVARIELPPLRRRTGDIGVLAAHFWRQLGGKGPIPASFVARLEAYSWPGNVRELHNAVAHEVALGELSEVEGLRRAPSAPEASARSSSADTLDAIIAEGLPYQRARDKALAAFDDRFVAHTLAKHNGNVTKAAAASGIARRYFYTIKARGKKDEP